jgi:hypothetical protein
MRIMDSPHESAAPNGHANGAANHADAPSAEGPAPSVDPTTARAEEIVDRWAANVAEFTSVWGRRAYRAAERVREEAQDLWAEAQSIRRGDQP